MKDMKFTTAGEYQIDVEIHRLQERIERMMELQIPFFIVDREKRKLRDLKDERDNTE